MTKPPKYYNQVRIPAGKPTYRVRLTKSMSQKQCCKLLVDNDICTVELSDRRFAVVCPHCMFDETNSRHWKQWKKETFKGVK